MAAAGALAAIAGVMLSCAPTPPPRAYQVEIRGMAFHPEALEVRRGDTVVWTNRDMVPHTATATESPGWSTGQLAQGERGRVVVRESGTAAYFCELHPTMQGMLRVR